jgi:osmotically-inducible protein OsmY
MDKTDSQLQQDILAELRWDPKINAAHIGVEVLKGVVTLSGHVDSFVEKWNAEQAVKRVPGVKILAVELDVMLPNDNKRSDTEIALAVSNALRHNIYRLDQFVKAKVEGAIVTLTGEAQWQYQVDAATNAIRYLAGVVGINNRVLLKPSISVSAVKKDIDDAIQRRARNDMKNIQVEIKGNEVLLSGKVEDWSERNLAIDAAWGVVGVQKVSDQMTIR